MTFEDFNKVVEIMVKAEQEIGKIKGIEYTQQGDRLDNFKRLSLELGITPKQVLWIYLKKHLDSILSYIKNDSHSESLSEPIESRIMDARVYLSLLRGLIEEEKTG